MTQALDTMDAVAFGHMLRGVGVNILTRDAAALVAGAGVARALDREPHEPLGRATIRTLGQAVAVTGVAGVVNGVLDEAAGLRPGWRSRLGHAAVTGTVAAM